MINCLLVAGLLLSVSVEKLVQGYSCNSTDEVSSENQRSAILFEVFVNANNAWYCVS